MGVLHNPCVLCIGLLTHAGQKSATHMRASPMNWCSRLLKTTAFFAFHCRRVGRHLFGNTYKITERKISRVWAYPNPAG